MREFAYGFLPIAALAIAVALPAAASADRTVYVTNGSSSGTGLAAFSAAGGPLVAVPDTPVATGTFPSGVAVSPDARNVYVANMVDKTVKAFSIGDDGRPTSLGAVPSGGNQPTALAVTPDGKFLMVTNRDTTTNAGPSVGVFAIDPDDGTITMLPSAPVGTGIYNPVAIAISPSGEIAYVIGRRGPTGGPALNDDLGIAALTIANNGALHTIPGGPFFFLGYRHSFGASITPDGRFMFVADTALGLQPFGLNANTGAPTLATTVPATGASGPQVPAVSPDGESVYVAASTGNAVEGFAIDQTTGDLSSIAGTPVAVSAEPHGIALGADGTQLYASLLSTPGGLTGFDVAADGGLTALSGSPFSTGGSLPGYLATAATPTQTPEVALTADVGNAGKKTGFDAGETVVRGGSATRFDWDFGDGTSLADGGSTVKHVYADAGSYKVKLTVRNDCAPEAVLSGGVASVGNAVYCNGAPEGSAIEKVKISDGQTPGGGRVKANLSAKRVQRQKRGRVVVKVKVKANEDVRASLRGKVKVAGHSYKLAAKKRSLAAGQRKQLKLKPVGKRHGRRIAMALRGGRVAKARLRGELVDNAGNTKTKKLEVKLKHSGPR